MKSEGGSPAAAVAVYTELSYRLDVCRERERERERNDKSENLLRGTFF